MFKKIACCLSLMSILSGCAVDQMKENMEDARTITINFSGSHLLGLKLDEAANSNFVPIQVAFFIDNLANGQNIYHTTLPSNPDRISAYFQSQNLEDRSFNGSLTIDSESEVFLDLQDAISKQNGEDRVFYKVNLVSSTGKQYRGTIPIQPFPGREHIVITVEFNDHVGFKKSN